MVVTSRQAIDTAISQCIGGLPKSAFRSKMDSELEILYFKPQRILLFNMFNNYFSRLLLRCCTIHITKITRKWVGKLMNTKSIFKIYYEKYQDICSSSNFHNLLLHFFSDVHKLVPQSPVICFNE